MRSGRAVPPAADLNILQGAGAWRAKRIPVTWMCAAVVLLVLTAVTLALLQYGGAGTFLTDAGIVAPSIPEWQHTHDVMSALMPGYAFAQVAQMMLNLTPADDTDDDYPTLNGAYGIAIFQIGEKDTYAAVTSFDGNGVQILNVTDPYNISAAGHVINGTDYPVLGGAAGIANFTKNGHTYLAVASFYGDGVQILNVTDPYNISAADQVINGTDYPVLDGAHGIAIFQTDKGDTYAAVTSFDGDGVQILDVTNPYSISTADQVINGTDYPVLDGASGITTFQAGGDTYAAVTSFDGDGVQILDVTNPYDISAAGYVTDGIDYPELNGARGIATFQAGGDTYAAVASANDDGVQILNVTDPDNISAAGHVTDGTDYPVLKRAHGITTFQAGGHTYAAVTSALFDNGVQILNVTDPDNISAAGHVTDYPVLEGARGIDIFQTDEDTYAAVASFEDDGVQIIKLTGTAMTPTNNRSPMADAGNTQTVNEGVTVTLDGSGSSDPDNNSLSYSWVSDGTPAITLTGQAPTFTAPQVGASGATVTFTLTVSDGNGGTDTDTVTITVNNVAANRSPMADAGNTQTVNEGVTVTLDGSGSSDPDNNSLSYSWVSDGTPAITLTGQAPTFTAPQVGASGATVTFTLTVSDGNGGTDTDTVTITVNNVAANRSPMADAGNTQTVNEGVTVTLDGSGSSDPDNNSLSYSWVSDGTPAITLTGQAPTFTAPQVGASGATVTFTLTVSDGNGGTDTDTVTITVNNVAANRSPMADAGNTQTVNEGVTVTLDGSGSSDPDNNSLSYSWVSDGTPAITLTGQAPTFTAPQVGASGATVTFTLTVSDGNGGTDTDTVTVTVNGVAPLPVLARGQSDSVTLTLSEVVLTYALPPNGFFVTTGGDPVSVNSITGNGTRTLGLGLTGPVSSPATLSYSGGDVADENGNRLASFSDLEVLFPSQRRGGGTTPPAVDLGTLAHQRLVDIPPHIAKQVASYDASDPLEPLIPDGTFDLPLVINGYGYLLDDTINTLVSQTVRAGDNSTTHITFTVYTQKDLAHFTLYLNLSDENTDYADSDTYITYTSDGTTVVTDPHGYIGSATVTVTQEDDQMPEKRTVRVTVEFGEEPMGPTNMVAYIWNTDRKVAFVKIIDAFEVAAASQEPEVQAADPEPAVPASELPADPEPVTLDLADDAAADTEHASPDALWPVDDYDDAHVLTLIRMWSGFESEMITDEQLLSSLGLDEHLGTDIPDWMMTDLGVLVAKGDVTVNEFMLALQYVLEHA